MCSINRNISFESEGQVSEVMQLVMDLANNTRLWENNGHTTNEIFEKYEKPNLRHFLKNHLVLTNERLVLRLAVMIHAHVVVARNKKMLFELDER